MVNKKYFSFNNLIFFLLIFSALLIPPLRFSFLPFAIEVTDLIFPFVLFLIFKNKWYKKDNKMYLLVGVVISAYILLTIIINNQIHYINNYFEIYKLLKLFFFFIFIKECFNPSIHYLFFDIIFVCLLLFNFLHYYNIFGFNETIMPLYCGENNNQLLRFGYYSNGIPGPKRMIGTMMNPNHNAILFIFFSILYAPRKEWAKKHIAFFFLSLLAMLLCQSRTGIAVFLILFVINYIFSKISLKKILIQSCLVFIIIATGLNVGTYIVTITDPDLNKTNSWQTRVQVWSMMIDKVKDKPFFGYSPNKEFFYSNQIHSDNEYISILYRYGCIGLILYIMLYIIPLFRSFKLAFISLEAKNIILCIILFGFTSLMNEPMSNPRTSLFYVFLLAVFYQYYSKKYLQFDIKNAGNQ